MKLNRKGFTLIELLATIVIVALVIGVSAYGIVNALKQSEEKTSIISESSILESARLYSSESGDDSWKKGDDYDSFCVTIGELMNKGLLDENAKIEGKTDIDDYVIVKRNKVTLAIESEELVSDDIGDVNNEICTGQTIITGEEITAPQIGSSISYTDKLVINFTPGSAEYNGNDSTITYRCLYGESSSNVNREGTVEDSKCVINNLKNNTDYYVLIYMNTNHDSSVLAEGDKEYKTSDFNLPTIDIDKNIVTIKYNDKDSNGNDINDPSHYFKTTIDGTTNVNVEKCELKNNTFTCSDSVTSVSKDAWYKVSDAEVSITYPEVDNDIKVDARIYDDSNNYGESTGEFTIKKYSVKFYKGSADSIDESTSEYIEKSCIGGVVKGNTVSCEVTSPSITRSGYTITGWNTSSSATTSSWTVGASKSVSSNATYYAITSKKVTITFNANGATSIGSTSQSCTMWNADENCSVTSPSITRSGYTITGWNTSSSATTSSWTVGASKSVSSNATYYAITSKKVTITFNANGATSIGSKSQSCTIQNSATTCSVKSPTITRSGYTIVGWNTSSSATTSSWAVGASKSVSSNATYYAITITSTTTINANRYNCSSYNGTNRLAIYYVTTCTSGTCSYNKLTGLTSSYSFSLSLLTPSWSVSESTLSTSPSSSCGQTLYANSAINCRAGANSSTSLVTTVSSCSSVYVYRSTMRVTSSNGNTYDYWYYPNNDCYLHGVFLSSSNPCSGSSGSGSSSSTCSPCSSTDCCLAYCISTYGVKNYSLSSTTCSCKVSDDNWSAVAC